MRRAPRSPVPVRVATRSGAGTHGVQGRTKRDRRDGRRAALHELIEYQTEKSEHEREDT